MNNLILRSSACFFKFFRKYLGLLKGNRFAGVCDISALTIVKFNKMLGFRSEAIASFSVHAGNILLPVSSCYYTRKSKTLLVTREVCVPCELTAISLLRLAAFFFSFSAAASWGFAFFDCVSLTGQGLTFQISVRRRLNLVDVSDTYALIRAFLWSYFLTDFSERAEFDGQTLGPKVGKLNFRPELMLFNSAKFMLSDNSKLHPTYLVRLSRSLLGRISLLRFSLESGWGAKVRNTFWVRRFYTGQLDEYLKGLLFRLELVFLEGAVYRDDFRTFLVRFLGAQAGVSYFRPSSNYWITESLPSLPPTSFLKFNSGPVNVIRFAQIGAGAFHHQFFLLLNLPLASDVATRSIRHSLPKTLPRAVSTLDSDFLFFDRISQDFLLRGIAKNVRNSLDSTLGLGYLDVQSFFFDNYRKVAFFNVFDSLIYEQSFYEDRFAIDFPRVSLRSFYQLRLSMGVYYSSVYSGGYNKVSFRKPDSALAETEVIRF